MGKLLPSLLFGVLIGAAATYFITSMRIEDAIDYVGRHIAYLVLLGLAILIVLFVLYVFKDLISKIVFGVATREIKNLVTDVSKVIREVEAGRHARARIQATKVGKEIVASISMWMARTALTRFLIALVVATVGAFGTYVLVQQNDLIAGQSDVLRDQLALSGAQTDLIRAQTDILRDQTSTALMSAHLQNAARRAAFAGEVNAIISDIRREAAEAVTGSGTVDADEPPPAEDGIIRLPPFRYLTLSNGLYDRIEAILPTLTPYVQVDYRGDAAAGDFLDIDAVDFRYLSPERGQILQAMLRYGVNLNPDIRGRPNEQRSFDFSHADMRGFQHAALPVSPSFYCDDTTIPRPWNDFSGGTNPPDTFNPTQSPPSPPAVRFEDDAGWPAPLVWSDWVFDSSSVVTLPESLYRLHNVRLHHADFTGAYLSGVRIELSDHTASQARFNGTRLSQSLVEWYSGDALPSLELHGVCLFAGSSGMHGITLRFMPANSLGIAPIWNVISRADADGPAGVDIHDLEDARRFVFESSSAMFARLDGLTLVKSRSFGQDDDAPAHEIWARELNRIAIPQFSLNGELQRYDFSSLRGTISRPNGLQAFTIDGTASLQALREQVGLLAE